MKILLIGEGNFSYTLALLKKIATNVEPNEEIIVISTDYVKHEEDLSLLTDKLNLPVNIKVTFMDNFDATKNDPRVSSVKFDRIICNFPTPFGRNRFDMDNLFSNIAKSNWLNSNGTLEISYWVDSYSGGYEYAYRLARAQKINGFKLIGRNIFDIKKWEGLGYKHIIHSGEEKVIDQFPMIAVYKHHKSFSHHLNETDYDELSDSEDLSCDAMPCTRGWTNFFSAHKTEKLNFRGQKMPRWKYKLELYNKDKSYYSINRACDLLDKKIYREAEIIINLLVFEASKDNKYQHKLVKWWEIPNRLVAKIEADYNSLPSEQKPRDEDLSNYHNLEWYSKLKVLTGVEIPRLQRGYKWN